MKLIREGTVKDTHICYANSTVHVILCWTFHYIRFKCCIAADQSLSGELCNAEIPRCNNHRSWVSTTYLTKENWKSALSGYIKTAFHCICISFRLQRPWMQFLRHDRGTWTA